MTIEQVKQDSQCSRKYITAAGMLVAKPLARTLGIEIHRSLKYTNRKSTTPTKSRHPKTHSILTATLHHGINSKIISQPENNFPTLANSCDISMAIVSNMCSLLALLSIGDDSLKKAKKYIDVNKQINL